MLKFPSPFCDWWSIPWSKHSPLNLPCLSFLALLELDEVYPEPERLTRSIPSHENQNFASNRNLTIKTIKIWNPNYSDVNLKLRLWSLKRNKEPYIKNLPIQKFKFKNQMFDLLVKYSRRSVGDKIQTKKVLLHFKGFNDMPVIFYKNY